MSDELQDSLPGANRIVPWMKNSTLYISVLIGWSIIFQIIWIAINIHAQSSGKDFINGQTAAFILSTNYGGCAFMWWAWRGISITKSMVTGKHRTISGLKTHNAGGILAVAVTTVATIAAHATFNDMLFTMDISVAITNMIYVTWGALSYLSAEQTTAHLKTTPLVPPGDKQDNKGKGVKVEGDLNG